MPTLVVKNILTQTSMQLAINFQLQPSMLSMIPMGGQLLVFGRGGRGQMFMMSFAFSENGLVNPIGRKNNIPGGRMRSRDQSPPAYGILELKGSEGEVVEVLIVAGGTKEIVMRIVHNELWVV